MAVSSHRALARSLRLLALPFLATGTPAFSPPLQDPALRDIRVGEKREGSLPPAREGPAPTSELALQTEATGGWLTIRVESPDFDARLRVLDAAGTILAEDRSSGCAGGAWLTREFPGGRNLRLLVDSEDGFGGAFTLSVASGHPPPPTGPDQLQGTLRFWTEAAGRLRGAPDTPENALQQAWCAAKTAECYRALGDSDKARAEFARAVGALKAITPPDPARAAEVLVSAGKTAYRDEDYGSAADLLERALALGPRTALLPQTRGFLGDAYLRLGSLRRARACYEEIGKFARRSGNQSAELGSLFSLAAVLHELGELEEARQGYENVLTFLRDGRLAPDARAQHEVTTLQNLGVVLENLEDLAAARRAYEEAQGIAAEFGIPQREAELLVNLGRVARLGGSLEEAGKLFDRALEKARATKYGAAEAGALDGQALLRIHRGDLAEARALANRALEKARSEQAWSHLLYPLSTLAKVALAEGDPRAAGVVLAEAEATLFGGKFNDVGSRGASGVRSRFAEWGELSQDRVALSIAKADSKAVDEISREGLREAGKWKGRALLEGIGRTAPSAAPKGGSPEFDRALESLLGPDRALVEYACGRERLYAYLFFRGRVSFHDLGSRQEIEAAVLEFLRGIADPEALASSPLIAEKGSALRRRLLDPILPSGESRPSALVLVPTSILTRLPFEALVTGTRPGSGALRSFDDLVFLDDDYLVSYAPASPVLAALADRGPSASGRKALVVGDPICPSERPSQEGGPSERSLTFDRMPGFREEALSVCRKLLQVDPERSQRHAARLLSAEGERSVALETEGFDLYLGDKARVSLFEGDLRRYRLIHCTAHGYVDASDPKRAALVFTHDPQTDGLLDLSRVLRTTIDAHLVVLSACHSARGRLLKGEGVQSVANAFLEAGSRAVIASLWEVNDRDTETTMKVFYDRLLPGRKPPAEALREARAHLRKAKRARGIVLSRENPKVDLESAHPYFWAPFICMGVPR